MDTVPDPTVNVRELRDHLADYLGRVRAGETLVVVSHGQPIARLVPMEPPLSREQLFGIMKGKIWMAPDFDADDPDIADAAEAGLE